MTKNFYSYINYLFLIFGLLCNSQNNIEINAKLEVEEKVISINQNITYYNKSNDTLNEIYLNDWIQSYSNKNTPLAKRFEEEFNTKFHLANKKDRGYTEINSISQNNNQLAYNYSEKHPDVIKVQLNQPIYPGKSYSLHLDYKVILPNTKFTGYGINKNNDLFLKYWYISPAVYTNKWHTYSNKNLDDLFFPKSDINIVFTHPKSYKIISDLNAVTQIKNENIITKLSGLDRLDTYLEISKNNDFETILTQDIFVVSDINQKGLSGSQKAIFTDRVITYIKDELGDYPHDKLLLTELEYNREPLYGLNQLPDILRPFSDQFQFELKLLKIALKKHLDNTLLLNPRAEHWLKDGIQVYYLMKYVDTFYPNEKLLGKLSSYWGIKSFHAADLDFNFRYFLFAMEIARKNIDQAVTLPKDKLIKFNSNIASRYKVALGLKYLNDYATDLNLDTTLKGFLNDYKLKSVTTEDFKKIIKNKTEKKIDWFFEDYLNTRKKIDFKIKSIKENNDSLYITIKNKKQNKLPVPIFKLDENEKVISKFWVDNVENTKTIILPKDHTSKFVIDFENSLLEFNQRNNYKAVNQKLFNNKPFQIRLLKDIEDPNYNQIFLMPLVKFNNIYDGLTLGTKVYNKTILRKRLDYRFSPQYATNSKSLTGSGSVFYTHNLENTKLFRVTYGINVSYQSFAEDAFFTRVRPSIQFSFRDNNDLRKDQVDHILLRYIDIHRSIGDNAILEFEEEPNYGVLNLRYTHLKPGIINFSRFNTDLQVANNFSKISVNYEFRKLTKTNRNINFRFFAGTFLNNNTDLNSNFFSFALDRPTDYLFDLNYLGRSEASGIFSQQIIIAEGGFKSMLETPFANQWMTTANFSTSIWRYIQAYGDVGYVKNKYSSAKFVYDSGIRLNLVEDYFEIFFPIYSSLGWEIGQPNYEQSIRFMFTVDPQVLLGLFRRKWY